MNITSIFLTTFDTGSQSYTILYDTGVSYSFVHNDENKAKEAGSYAAIDAWVLAGNVITGINMAGNEPLPADEPEVE